MFKKRKSNEQDKQENRNRLEELSARQREKERFNKQPDRIRDNPGDTFVDIIIFLLIIAVITGLVFLYWAFSL
ncbi:hypothetical protein AAK938_08385 [Aerococcaceae bacterium 50-4]